MGLIFFAALCALWLWIAVIDFKHFLIDRLLCLFVVLIFSAYLWWSEAIFWVHLGIGLFYWIFAYILYVLRPRMIGVGDCDLIGTCFFVFGAEFLLLGGVGLTLFSLAVFCYFCWRRGKWGLKRGFPLGVAASLNSIVITALIIFEISLKGTVLSFLVPLS